MLVEDIHTSSSERCRRPWNRLHIANERMNTRRIMCIIYTYYNAVGAPMEVLQHCAAVAVVCPRAEPTIDFRLPRQKTNRPHGDIIHKQSTINTESELQRIFGRNRNGDKTLAFALRTQIFNYVDGSYFGRAIVYDTMHRLTNERLQYHQGVPCHIRTPLW